MHKSLWCLCGHLPTYKNQLHISILSWKFGWTFKNLVISLTKSILSRSSWTRIVQGMEFLMAEEELQTFSFSIIVNRTKKLRTNQSELIFCTFYSTFCKERSQKTPKFEYQTFQIFTIQIVWKWINHQAKRYVNSEVSINYNVSKCFPILSSETLSNIYHVWCAACGGIRIIF